MRTSATAEPTSTISRRSWVCKAQAELALAKVGSDKTRLLSATIYLTDFANLAAFNAVWDAWFAPGTAPSRACVKAELASPGYLVEIAFVAAAGEEYQA
jgi:enamine deaminase RidA (YjgF/YER057c/UK114 family)